MGAVSPLAPEPWRDSAACAAPGVDIEWFFPPKTGRPHDAVKQVGKAKQVCATCPVQEECLAYAVANHIHYGVWGGKTPRERRPGRLAAAHRCRWCGRLFDADSNRLYCSKVCRGEASRAVRREHMRKVRLGS